VGGPDQAVRARRWGRPIQPPYRAVSSSTLPNSPRFGTS